jgi:hypothetical protein
MTCHAQSTAETAEGIKRELDGIKTEFVSTLQSAASNPENLQSGQTKANCEQILSKLESLQSRLNSTTDMLAKRETDLNGKAGLSEADKLELKQTLQAQRKPIEACKQTAAQLQTELKSLNASKIPVIQEIYKNYLDIAGPEQAKAKVEASIQPLLAPYLPPKPRSTPTPKASPSPSLSAPQNAANATPQQSMPTILPAQLDQSQSELQQAKAVKAQLAKILNETNNTPPPATQTAKTPKAKKQSIPIWSPTDKLPKEVRGHGLAGNFAIQGSSSDGSIILVPADDANNPFARQFWIVNRSFSGGPNVLVPLGQRRIIQVPSSHPLIRACPESPRFCVC